MQEKNKFFNGQKKPQKNSQNGLDFRREVGAIDGEKYVINWFKDSREQTSFSHFSRFFKISKLKYPSPQTPFRMIQIKRHVFNSIK